MVAKRAGSRVSETTSLVAVMTRYTPCYKFLSFFVPFFTFVTSRIFFDPRLAGTVFMYIFLFSCFNCYFCRLRQAQTILCARRMTERVMLYG